MTKMLAGRERRQEPTDASFGRVETPAVDTETALEALGDADCRRLLRAAAEEPHTAGELIEACSIPRSTAYRKIDLLTEAGLFEEGIRIRSDGKHAGEYRLAVEELTVSLSAGDGVEAGASRPAALGD